MTEICHYQNIFILVQNRNSEIYYIFNYRMLNTSNELPIRISSSSNEIEIPKYIFQLLNAKYK